VGRDVYFKKQITYACRGHTFVFDLAHTLFSSFEVDKGSDLLLRTIDLPTPPHHILDLGCGHGVLGIVLARLFPTAQVTLLDKDLLAVRYAHHNAQLNQATNIQALGSVGLEQLATTRYDVIVSNIPAKVGDQAIEQEFVHQPLRHLHDGGAYWFVVVSGLNHLIPRIGTHHCLKLKEMKKRSGHTVYRLVQ
jgi:16S rRNA (guanine1207-N2)-methyltransferase